MVAAAGVYLAAQAPALLAGQEGVVTGFVRYASGGPIADVRVTLMVARPGTAVLTPEAREVRNTIPDGSSRRVVTARVVMNAVSADRPVPMRIGIGVRQNDGMLVIPLEPGDQRLVVRLPEGYFLDSATHGAAQVYSLAQVGGRRLTSGAFAITVPPEPQAIPELVITLGAFR